MGADDGGAAIVLDSAIACAVRSPDAAHGIFAV
jgi:hypothetical protein